MVECDAGMAVSGFVVSLSLFLSFSLFFFFNDTATTEIYTLSLHDALPILKILYIFRKGDYVLP